jgi:tRNA G10  N-methylase Trm11
MQTLGGVVKILEVVSIGGAPDLDALATHIIGVNEARNKITFGASVINAPEYKGFGLALKRVVQEKTDRPVRFVTSNAAELSSATIKLEGLLPPDGIELVVFKDSSTIYVAQTIQIQSFAEWSFRDYARPGRDAKRGMLPPKLAKMMLNIATRTRDITQLHIYDPFCGSGTMLIEASLLGAKKVTGSDLARAAVDDANKALTWARGQFDFETMIDVFCHDATKKPDHLKPASVDLIVTEPFLGRPLGRGQLSTPDEKKELVRLYTKMLTAVFPLLSLGGAVVLALPFQTKPFELLPLNEILGDTPLAIDPLLPEHDTVLYAREDQRTGRQIIRLVKI